MKKFVSLLLAAVLLSSAVTLAGCKNDDRDSQTESVVESKTTNDKTATSDQIKTISAEIDALKAQPAYSDTGSLDAKKIAKNKTIGIVLDSSSDAYSLYIAAEIKAAAGKAGFKDTIVYETDGTSNSHVSALENVIGDKCAAAVLVGNIDKDAISTSIETVQANGIKVLSINNAAKGEKEHYVDSTIAVDYAAEAKALADYAVVQHNGQVNALLIVPSELNYSETMRNAVADELKNYSGGYCTELNAETATWNNGLADVIKSSLQKDTNINCVIVLHEGMLKDTVDALEMAQAMSKVTLLSRGGGTEAFTQIQNGNASMVSAESYEWTAYITVDYLLKLLGGNDNPTSLEIPFMMTSYDNVKKLENSQKNSDEDSDEDSEDESDNAPLIESVFEKAFKDGFLKSWKIKTAEQSSDEPTE